MRKFISAKNMTSVAFLVLVTSSVALASEHQEKQPGIWDGDWFTSIFAILLFGAMILVLGKYAWGPILSGLKQREDYINTQIKDAEQAKSDADKALRRYEARLEKAEEQAKEMLDKSRVEAETIARRLTEEAQNKAADIIRQAHITIEGAREQAVRDLHVYSGELAVELAGKILGRSISAQDHQALIAETIGQLKADSR